MWFRASKHDLENQKDLSRDTEELSYDEVLKQIQYDILQLQVEMESLKNTTVQNTITTKVLHTSPSESRAQKLKK